MTLQLVLGSNTLDLDDWSTHGIVVNKVDLGFPQPREVVTNLPGVDGNYDETAFLGTRVVTLTGSLGRGSDGSRSHGMALLAPFLAPSARPQLVFSLDEDRPDRALTLRAADFTAPIAGGESAVFSISWKCPDPIAYGLITNQVTIPPNVGTIGGRAYPRTFPTTYPASIGGGGTAYIINAGDYISWPKLHIFGPCTNPAVYWLDNTGTRTGTQVVFIGISLADGDYLAVDTRAQTVTLNDDVAANRYSFLDFAHTKWGPLQAGYNRLQFSSVSATEPALTYVLWQDTALV